MTAAIVSRGVDFVKTNATERAGLPETDPRRQFYSEAELRAIVTEAGSAGVPVAAHAHGDEGARAAVEAGVRSIEHGTYIGPETLARMVDMGTFLVPTIAIVRDLTIPGGDYDNAVLNIRGRHMLPRVREMARRAHEMGVKVVAVRKPSGSSTSPITSRKRIPGMGKSGTARIRDLRRAARRSSRTVSGCFEGTGDSGSGCGVDAVIFRLSSVDPQFNQAIMLETERRRSGASRPKLPA
jgi:hypothetical protein